MCAHGIRVMSGENRVGGGIRNYIDHINISSCGDVQVQTINSAVSQATKANLDH